MSVRNMYVQVACALMITVLLIGLKPNLDEVSSSQPGEHPLLLIGCHFILILYCLSVVCV